MKKKSIPNRRPCLTTDVGEGLSVSVSFHPETGEPIEASDSPMQDALYNLGVQASDLMRRTEPSEEKAVQQSAE